MGRINFIEVANTRDVIGYAEISFKPGTGASNNGEPLIQMLLSYPNCFSHETNSIIIPKAFVVKEFEPDEYLKKNNLTIEFILDDGAEPTNKVKYKGIDYITGVELVLASQNYYNEYYDMMEHRIWAVSYKKIETDYYIAKLNGESLYFVVKAGNNFQPYTVNTVLTIGMFYKLN